MSMTYIQKRAYVDIYVHLCMYIPGLSPEINSEGRVEIVGGGHCADP